MSPAPTVYEFFVPCSAPNWGMPFLLLLTFASPVSVALRAFVEEPSSSSDPPTAPDPTRSCPAPAATAAAVPSPVLAAASPPCTPSTGAAEMGELPSVERVWTAGRPSEVLSCRSREVKADVGTAVAGVDKTALGS